MLWDTDTYMPAPKTHIPFLHLWRHSKIHPLCNSSLKPKIFHPQRITRFMDWWMGCSRSWIMLIVSSSRLKWHMIETNPIEERIVCWIDCTRATINHCCCPPKRWTGSRWRRECLTVLRIAKNSISITSPKQICHRSIYTCLRSINKPHIRQS